MDTRFRIRDARKSDTERILGIENVSFPMPWNEQAFKCEFSKQASGMNIFFVYEDVDAGDIAGYAVGLRVQAAIARLSPSDRDVLSLVLWEQLTQIEAATVLGCSVNAVALRLRKAKGRLRDELMRDQTPSTERFRSSSLTAQEKEHRDES